MRDRIFNRINDSLQVINKKQEEKGIVITPTKVELTNYSKDKRASSIEAQQKYLKSI